MGQYFPVFIDVEGRKVTVVGAGAIASRRVRTLLDFGVQITVIAPEAAPEIEALARAGRIVWRREAYCAWSAKSGREAADPAAQDSSALAAENTAKDLLGGSLFVLAATDDPAVNQAVQRDCKALDIPVNLADDKDSCDFYFPAIAKGGGIVTGVISEGGKDHRLTARAAAAIRTLLAELI